MHKFIATGIFLLWTLPAQSKESESATIVRFPAVSTILDNTEAAKIESLAIQEKSTDHCVLIKGFFSPERSQWTYRIVGRTRVLEVYRILVTQGVAPEKIRISSLGPLNETREYRAKPSGQDVQVISVPAEHPDCAPLQSAAASDIGPDRMESLYLDYDVLDADPSAPSFSKFLGQVRAHKDEGSELSIETYSDMTGARYLNRVLSRLRALVLLRHATLEGYPVDRIKLRWNGSVQSQDPGLPEPVVKVQRRSVVRFVTNERPETQAVESNPAPKAVETEASLPAETLTQTESQNQSPEPKAMEFAGFVALATGPSSLKSYVGTGKGFGLRGAYLLSAPSQGVRFGLDLQIGRDSFQPKSSMLTGGHTIDAITFSGLWLNTLDLPLSLRAGLRYENWSGEVTHKKLDETKKFSGHDFAPYAAVGYRFMTGDDQWLEPRFELDNGIGDLRGIGVKAILEYGITRGVQ